jgi:hypothetical protein
VVLLALAPPTIASPLEGGYNDRHSQYEELIFMNHAPQRILLACLTLLIASCVCLSSVSIVGALLLVR